MSITTTMDPALVDQGNLLKMIGPLIRGMILRIHLVHQYSSKFGNSQQQFTVTEGRWKHYTSKYRKMATEISTMKTMATVYSYENKCATNYRITNNNWNDTHNKQLTKHNKYTNDDVDFDDCVAYMH